MLPLVEVSSNPIYKKQIAKAINFSNVEYQSNVINLQDENINTYDQIFHGFSLLLPHISVTLSTKANNIFRGTFYVAMSTH
jgi:hypothetical protein